MSCSRLRRAPTPPGVSPDPRAFPVGNACPVRVRSSHPAGTLTDVLTPSARRFAIVTLGCARNETDSQELAGRLADQGWQLVDDAADADAVLVNTCGFIEAAKKDSVDTL